MSLRQAIGAVRTSVRAGPLRNDRLGRFVVLLVAALVEVFARAPRPDEAIGRNRRADDEPRPEDAVVTRLVITQVPGRDDWIVAAAFEDGTTLPITQPGSAEMAERLLTILERAGR